MALITELVSSPVKTVHPDTTVAAVARLMREESIGSLVVVDDDRCFVGMVTDRDIVVRMLAEGLDADSTTAGQICTEDGVSVFMTGSIPEVLELMHRRLVRRVPVLDGKRRPIGILSIEDLAASEHVTDSDVRALLRAIGVAYRTRASHVLHGQ